MFSLYVTCFQLWLSCAACKEVRVAVLVPITGTFKVGDSIRPAIKAAFDDVNNDPNFLVGVNLTYTVHNSACDSVKAVGLTADLMRSSTSVDAYIGPGCSVACLSAGLLARHWNKPIISFSCSSLELEDRNKYATFARTQPFSRTYSESTPLVLFQIMRRFKWQRSAILAKDDGPTSIWAPIANNVYNHFKSNNLTVSYYNVYKVRDDPEKQYRDTKKLLAETKKYARVLFILATRTEVARLLLIAKELGMLKGDFAFITLDFYISESLRTSLAKRTWSLSWEKMLGIFEGLITLSVKKPGGEELKNITKWLNKGLQDMAVFQNLTATFLAAKTAPYLYDAVLLYSYALNRTLSQGGNISNGTTVFKNMVTKTPLFTGMSGPVKIDEKGNRVPHFVFENIHESSGSVLLELDSNGAVVMHSNVLAVWPGGSTKIPEDEPECLFDDSCKDSDEQMEDWLIVVIVFSSFTAILVPISYFLYRRRMYEKDLLNDAWIIDFSQITLGTVDNKFASKVIKSLNSHQSVQTEWVGEGKLFHSNVGRYKGELVAIKRLHKDSIHRTRDILIEMKQVRDIVHTNINPYIGVCITSPNVSIISHYCYRGSLEEILANHDIKLDWFFRASFAQDIAMGLSVLHASPVHVHGHLRSSKCLIDSRWVCKVSDYGLSVLKVGQRVPDISEHAKYRKLFWTAPEYLCEDAIPRCSQAGDAYSYGIILSELLNREEPYSSLCMDPKDVIEQVRKRLIPPIRPDLPSEIGNNKGIIHLMQTCWDNDPLMRPAFSEIKSKLKSLTRGKNANIVDNMIRMMENYTDQLENLVDERTMQLAEEKAKTDELLYKMLPKPIAEDLKLGRSVTAESFSSVTIYFSDIVGFTSMAAQCTPLQVVHFLNDLYTCFDNVIDSHDVYKVETIGDAYMVVSGLPIRNGNKHAGEIATMALNLLSSTRDFTTQHMPNKGLQLRIGIHTGPCVAGVVGLKMPRYCLFGDTVNYASRMESSGLALRIHLSPECKTALDQLGVFHLEQRGPVSIKGKGTIITYFLNGKDGFTKLLPDLCEAAPLTEHEFK
ncbi:atrial natriuretic peptide receptor 1-like isoform X2 [Stylophora pistillata]|uniref:atrial natriuretic peptide receptor 1-like isoform X2 n=1 Tax=Stylophora pistillata TaxID=50429 RepID=UPI000C040DEF|nr:atrial natriuretic peptide receptor 1-like isoform X2 [Stylophora pistillata]